MTETLTQNPIEEPTPRKRGRPSSLLPQVRQCARCGADFDTMVNPETGDVAKGNPTTYCSRACSLTERNAAEGNAQRTAYDADPVRCPCGVAIAYEKRHTTVYCSPEHRKQYQRPSKVRDEANWTTTTCETCHNDFEHRTDHRRRFCSNLCAAKHTKKVQHVVVDSNVFDSSWEAFIWGACKVAKIDVERCDRESHGVQFGSRFYCPDFYLPRYEVYIEVKGVQSENAARRQEAFRAAGHRLLVLGRGDLMGMSPWRLRDIVKDL